MNSRAIFEKRIRQAVKASTIDVRETAQEQHRFTSRTGNLEKAIDYQISNSGMQGVVFLDSDVAKYGPFVHEGTPAHVINPRFKKVLRFIPRGGNGFVFARRVFHPGTAPDPFLYDAIDRKRGDVYATFAKATNMALDDISGSDWLGKADHEIRIRL